MTTTSLFDLALERHRAGRLAEAETLYRQVLSQDPSHASAAFLLGAVALGSGRPGAAVDLLRRATRLDPSNAAYHANLGEAYRRLRRHAESVDSFEQALLLKPDFAEPIFNLGLLLQEVGELEPAIACFERALEVKRDSPVVAGQLEQARGAYLAAIDRPTTSDDAAAEALCVRAWLTLAAVHRSLGRRADAVSCCRRALGYAPRSIATLLRLAEVLFEEGLTDEASVRLRQVLEIDPGHKEALARLLEVLESSCRLEEAVALLRQCLTVANVPSLRSLLVLTLPYLPGYDDAAILREATAWDREHAAPLSHNAKPSTNDRSPERRLRVGYVAPYFRDHAHKFFLHPLLSNHDRRSFEFFFYSDVAQPDAETEHLRAFADGWRDTVGLDDDAMADLVRADRIDILVDLAMHTQNGRLLAFARKPAPIQLCWLAYPGTTGLSTMDYRVSDPHLDPPEADRSVYAEQTLLLPDSFWCYSPRTSGPNPTPLPALTEGRITFGCLNNFCKVNAGVLETWAEVLNAVERSVLVLLAPPGDVRRRASSLFAERGVDTARVRFVHRRPRDQYLTSYGSIDVCLDTFPCNGHTTSMDALWMGVPVVTLAGDTVMGRAGVCLAMNLGLPELIARTPRDYVRVAVELTSDLPRLGALRAGLRPRMERSPLMDGPRFAKNMESLYRRVWRQYSSQTRR
jgi:protein O-GlcNAc transferase